MSTYVIFCYINHDGIGDFTHYEDIIKKLEAYENVQLVSVILFADRGKPENYSRVEEKLSQRKGSVYYGKGDEHREIFSKNTSLIKQLNDAEQAFYISYKGDLSSIYDKHLRPNIPIKYIGEHEIALYTGNEKDSNRLNRSLGLDKDYFGNPCQGIKLLDMPPAQSTQAHWERIQQKDPDFFARVLACSQSSDIADLSDNHVFMAAYFNRCWDFFEFLRIFTVNTPDPSIDSFIIHYSGSNLFEFMKAVQIGKADFAFKLPEKGPYLEKLFSQGQIKELQLISAEPTQIVRIKGSSAGTISIKIVTGFYLSDISLQSMYQLSKLVAVSGDNTFELAVSMNVLPFYCSTNWDRKKRTLRALRTITQLPELGISDTAKQSFNLFFAESSVETRGYCDFTFPEHDRCLQLTCYSQLDFPAMIEAWPTVCAYIRAHHNFYDRLDTLVREGLSTVLRQDKQITHMSQASEESGVDRKSCVFFLPDEKQAGQPTDVLESTDELEVHEKNNLS